MAGYSSTPLPKKLGIKSGTTLLLAGAPKGFDRLLKPLPVGVRVRRRRGEFDVAVAFVTSQQKLKERLDTLPKLMAENGGLWVAWPKKSSGVTTDVSEDVIRAFALGGRLVDNKVCAIDDTWSGLRLVLRLEHRSKASKSKRKR